MPAPKAPRGTSDILPPESERLTELEGYARTLFDRFGYRRVEVPIFEHTELFERTVGESSDVVVQKQMFTFVDARGRSLTLRPEGTAGVVRAYIANRPDQTLGTPVRLWYWGPFFRYERPARGVERQYYSVGVEVFGSSAPLLDAEVIVLGKQFFEAAGMKPKILLNSIGCPNDRTAFLQALRDSLADHVDDLCDDCHRRLQTNPMRVFDCKIPSDQKIIRKHAPTIREYLCEECKAHHATVERVLESLGVAWEDDPYLVRGLDYYTRTVFEYVLPGVPSVGGGGRYDLLVEQLGGKPTPAVGFGLGVSRLMVALEGTPVAGWSPDVHVIWLGDIVEIAMAVAMDLRAAGLRVTVSDEPRSMRSQMNEANRAGASKVVILGSDEVARKVATVKDLSSGEQAEIALDRLVKEMTS